MKKTLVLAFLLPLMIPVSAAASAFLYNPLCSGGGVCVTTVSQLIVQITSYIFKVVGVLAVLMFVVAGIYFIFSMGEPGKITKARNIAFAAAIGAAIAIAGTGLVGLISQAIGGPAP